MLNRLCVVLCRFGRRALTALVILASLTLAGCSTRSHELQNGGTLRLALSEWPAFNPLYTNATSGDVLIAGATYPTAFNIQADGSPTHNTDYFSDVQSVGADPQIVTYTINPKAVWTDGSPITWEDISSQVHALSGLDRAFAVGDTSGYDEVASVRRGIDYRQAVVTFKHPYAAWRSLFAGDRVLLPRTLTATPDAFNGQHDRPAVSAGPFVVTSVDRAAQQIVLTHNPRWWGAPPHLDSITYRMIDRDKQLRALRNNELDALPLGPYDTDAIRFSWNYELAEARLMAGIAIRTAPYNDPLLLFYNGAPGAVLADKDLRIAVSLGIDRETIASVFLRGAVDNPRPLNNHIFVIGMPGYHDNAPWWFVYDPAAARRKLDDLGWRLNGDVREKDGKKLIIRYVLLGSAHDVVAQMVRNDLARIGVKVTIVTDPPQNFRDTGSFDITSIRTGGDVFAPLMSADQRYGSAGRLNYGKILSPEVDWAITQAVSQPDERMAEVKINDVDRTLWTEFPSLPLLQIPDVYAVSSNIANFGALGLADVNFASIGFTN